MTVETRRWCVSNKTQMQIDYEKLGTEIRASFSELLKQHVPSDFCEKAKQRELTKIISVACGKFIEAECLSEYFSFCKNLKFYGIEINEPLLNQAKERLVVESGKKNVFLKIADASELDNYVEWINDGLFNLIVVRHPEITFNTNIFMKIFAVCFGLLEKGGLLLITTHLENEKKAVKYLLEMLGFKILVEIENTNAASSEQDGKTVYADKFLFIATSEA